MRRRRQEGDPIDQADIDMLADCIRTNKNVVFISGAGISVASGIPTYRGTDDSVWKKCKVTSSNYLLRSGYV